MNYKRIGRTLICLLLVCVLLVNVSPIRAEASAVGVATAIGATIAVGSILYGLGVRYAQDYDSYVTGLENWADFMASTTDFITPDGLATVVSLGSGTYGVSSAFVQACRDILWDYGYVQEAPSIPAGITDYPIGNLTVTLDTFYEPLLVFVGVDEGATLNKDTLYYVFVAGSLSEYMGTKPGFSVEGATFLSSYYTEEFYCHDGMVGVRARYVRGYTGPLHYLPADWQERQAYITSLISDSTEVIPADGFAVDFVAKPSLSLAEGYPEWAANSVVIDGQTYYPIATAPTVEALKDVTQEQVWAGTAVGEVGGSTDTDIDTDALTQAGLDATIAALTVNLGKMIGEWFEEHFGLLSFIAECVNAIYKLFEPVAEWFATIIDGIGTIAETLIGGIPAIIDAIAAIPGVIADAIADVLAWAFAPSETFIQTKVEALIANYPTAATFSELGHSFRGFFDGLGEQPPIIYIDLGASEGDYVYGGRMAFIDLTWYARYKPTVDTILGAFIWLWVAWRFFVSIPGIISGAPGIFGSPNEKPDIEFHAPRFEVGKNWLNSGSSYHKNGDGGGV